MPAVNSPETIVKRVSYLVNTEQKLIELIIVFKELTSLLGQGNFRVDFRPQTRICTLERGIVRRRRVEGFLNVVELKMQEDLRLSHSSEKNLSELKVVLNKNSFVGKDPKGFVSPDSFVPQEAPGLFRDDDVKRLVLEKLKVKDF